MSAEPQTLGMPFNISCSNPAHHREPFAVFPFLERADLDTNIGSPAASATFSVSIHSANIHPSFAQSVYLSGWIFEAVWPLHIYMVASINYTHTC